MSNQAKRPYGLVPTRKPSPRIKFLSSTRHHAPTWILIQIGDLLEKANRQQDSSKVLYACLEARNLLEMIRYTKVQCSIPDADREALAESAVVKNGVEQINKKIKTLNKKYQDFFQAVSEDGNFPFPAFNSSECQKVLDKLHPYIHTYTINEKQMLFSSAYIKNAFLVVDEAVAFAKHNLTYIPHNDTYGIANIDVTTLPNWAKETLEIWKQDITNNMDNLKLEISKGIEKYNQEQQG